MVIIRALHDPDVMALLFQLKNPRRGTHDVFVHHHRRAHAVLVGSQRLEDTFSLRHGWVGGSATVGAGDLSVEK